MTLDSLETVFSALNAAGVRYLVAGGLAVNAHGYPRATHDVDLVVQLTEKNLEAAISSLQSLGYVPRAPVNAMDFARPSQREAWIHEKNMVVFAMTSHQHFAAPIDIFVSEPFNFDQEYEQALVGELAPKLPIRFVSLETLIEMKKTAKRAKDLDDIEHLQWIKQQNNTHN